MRLLPGWSMGNPRESKFWCTETTGERSLWYWYAGPGSGIRLDVWLSRVGGRVGGGVFARAQRGCARGGLSIRQLGNAFLLIGLLAAMVVLLLWMHSLVTVGFI